MAILRLYEMLKMHVIFSKLRELIISLSLLVAIEGTQRWAGERDAWPPGHPIYSHASASAVGRERLSTSLATLDLPPVSRCSKDAQRILLNIQCWINAAFIVQKSAQPTLPRSPLSLL